ncbi:MAG: phosphatidate cytidylyltransferase [Bacteriovorax sp.]|nr:phosphatidate cytidylyltransferase [Bacteriovorax sp.]
MNKLLLMTDFFSHEVLLVLGAIYFLIIILTLIFYSAKMVRGESKLINELIDRTRSWWVMLIIFTIVVFVNREIATIGIALLSLIAFRELSSNLNLRDSDRRTLLWCYVAIPFQFMAAYTQYFDFFVIFIPIIMYLFLTLRTVAKGDVENITRSIGAIHWSIMLTIFSFSHLAYVLSFPPKEDFSAGNGGMILFLILITELNDIFQFTCGKFFGKNKIIPSVSPNKTTEGFIGGMILTTCTAYLLKFLLPVNTEKTIILTILLCIVGFGGDITLSAVKREHKIKDMGASIPGHGGMMDRLDSLAFTSITFFYLIRYWCYK